MYIFVCLSIVCFQSCITFQLRSGHWPIISTDWIVYVLDTVILSTYRQILRSTSSNYPLSVSQWCSWHEFLDPNHLTIILFSNGKLSNYLIWNRKHLLPLLYILVLRCHDSHHGSWWIMLIEYWSLWMLFRWDEINVLSASCHTGSLLLTEISWDFGIDK